MISSGGLARRLGRGLGVLAWLACLATPTLARARSNELAEAGAGAGASTAAGADTLRMIKDAVAEYDARHFEEARALFRRAHAIEPSARTLRGIGMASYELRDYVEATRALSASLVETRRPLTPEQRQHAQGLLSRAETFVGRFTPRLTPPDGTLTVDGQPAEREADGALLLPFGHHLLVLRCPTCAPAERAVEVTGGERVDVDLVASAVEPSVGGDTPMKPNLAGAAAADRPSSSTGRAATWLGGGAILAAAGAVAGALWWHNRTNELDACEAAGAACLNKSTVSSQRNLAAGATIGLGVAALAAGATAAVLWQRADRGANLALGCSSDMKVVICEVTF